MTPVGGLCAPHVAAHCLSNGFGTDGPLATTAHFFSSNDPDFLPTLNGPGAAVSDIFGNSLYTGVVIDHNDIVVLRWRRKRLRSRPATTCRSWMT